MTSTNNIVELVGGPIDGKRVRVNGVPPVIRFPYHNKKLILTDQFGDAINNEDGLILEYRYRDNKRGILYFTYHSTY